MSPHKTDVRPSLASLSSYGISQNGFLPASPPLDCLPSAEYQQWEDVARSLPQSIHTFTLRQLVDELPVLGTHHLGSEPEWQRAYSILAMMAQAYIWGGETPSEHLPASIAVPLLAVSSHLEVNPIASYASLNLWNWRMVGNQTDPTKPENLHVSHTITGTEDESWFFVVSNAMEARAGPIIGRMLDAMAAVDADDAETVTASLDYMSGCLHEIASLLDRMDERCSPQTFYHDIRPYLAGSKNMEAVGLIRGVFYDEGNGQGSWRKYRGGSNGQSSLIQFFDVVLGIDQGTHSTFHEEMREYMPGKHARFISDVEACANIRGFVLEHPENVLLVSAFNSAIAALTAFRNTHIRLVTRYIILPSRQRGRRPSLQKNLAAVSTEVAAHTESNHEFVGTGGTKLVPFLRRTRDETSSMKVQ